MRLTLALLLAVVVAVPVLAQDGAGIFKNERYSVQATAPQGWKQVLSEAKPAGAWVDLTAYEEEKTGARLELSAQVTTFRSSDQMIQGLKEQFEKDATIAILRNEVRSGGRGPRWIFFEYTRKGARGPEHAIAAYWYLEGYRYRVFGLVREAGWRTVGTEMENFAKSVVFTSRAFSKDSQNYTDDAMNFRMYFPDGWAVRLPGSGPRVTFESARLGVSVWVYATETRNEFGKEMERLREQVESSKVQDLEVSGPQNHPTLNLPACSLEYRRGTGNKTVRHLETVFLHRERLYRIVLAASEQSFEPGLEPYGRMVDSIQFMR